MKYTIHFIMITLSCGILVSCRTSAPSMSETELKAREINLALSDFLISGNEATLGVLFTDKQLAVEAIETAIVDPNTMSTEKYTKTVRTLGSMRSSAREAALRDLQLAAPSILSRIENDLLTAKRKRIVNGLTQARESLLQGDIRRSYLQSLLPQLYSCVAPKMLHERLDALSRTPSAPRVQFFFTLTPYEVLKTLMPQDDAHTWGLYCLFLFYKHQGAAKSFEQTGHTVLVDALKNVSGDELLQVSTKLWPIELQPIYRDGSFFWTIRAAESSSTNALNVIKMSVARDSWRPKPVIMHLKTFQEVRFTPDGIEQYIRWDGSEIGRPGKVRDSWR